MSKHEYRDEFELALLFMPTPLDIRRGAGGKYVNTKTETLYTGYCMARKDARYSPDRYLSPAVLAQLQLTEQQIRQVLEVIGGMPVG